MVEGFHQFTALELWLQRTEEESKASRQKSISNELLMSLNWEEILAPAGADIMAEEFKGRERCAAVLTYPNWNRIPAPSSPFNSKGSVHISIIILLMIGCTSAAVLDTILGNLGSDLAPLISLFGEKPTIQYLSESLTLIDNIIFSLAPLGIITAIVSAIRVGGGPRLRSLIGRAQESRGAVEAELMSSTSPDVCEMWNGRSVIRVIGSPVLLQLIYKPSQDESEHEVFTLAEAVKKNIYTRQNDESDISDRDPMSASLDAQALRNPPNLSPNVSTKSLPKLVLVALGVFGTALQAGVLVFAALIQYKHITVVGNPNSIPEYAVYLLLGGTLLLAVGMFMCAEIIEKSTVEVYWKPTTGSQVVWLQHGGQNVAGQLFESFAQCQKNFTLTTSTKALKETRRVRVGFAVGFSLIGFAAQFIGFRSTHPYVILAQLCVILIMTIIRSLAHMGLKSVNEIEKPDNQGDGHEVDWLARKLKDCKRWEVVVGTHNSYYPTKVLRAESSTKISKSKSAKIRLNLAAAVMKTRSRLAELSKEWPLKNRERVGCLKKAIEGTMNEVYANMGLSPDFSESTAFAWTLRVRTDRKSATSNITLTLTRSKDESDSWTAWRTDEYDLEAVLCLWISFFKENRKLGEEPPKRIRLLGLYSEQAKIDYELWIKRGTKLNNSLESSPQKAICFGWARDQPDHDVIQNDILNVNAEEDVETLCAQEIYTTFMFRLGGIIENVRGETTPRTNNPTIESSLSPSIRSSSGRFCLINSNLASLATVYSSSGLGSIESAYLCIIPALRASDKLPIEDNVLSGIRRLLDARDDISSALSSDEGRALFKDVSKSGPYKIVQWFLSIGVDVNAPPGGSPARTGLQSAAEGGDDEIVRLLLSHGAYFNAEAAPESGRTAMQAAAEKGHESIVRILIAAGADVNEAPGKLGGCTALHAAANEGHSKIVELLLEKGAKINQKLEGRTALQTAARAGRKAVAEVLCGKGAKGDEVVNGQAALHLAAQAGHEAIVKLFLDKGVDVNAKVEGGQTALHLAAKAGNTEIVRLLCEKEAEVDVTTGDRTALHLAAHAGRRGAVEVLLDKGANINATAGDRTPVFLAAEAGHARVVKYLISRKAEIHDSSIMSLHRAAKERRENAVKLLVLGGANVRLDIAAGANETETVQFLLHAGAEVDAPGNSGQTALQAAAEAGHENIVELLFKEGADINAGAGDQTAIFLAAKAGRNNIVNILLAKGADIHDQTGKRMSLHSAAKAGLDEIIKTILGEGADVELDVAAEAGEVEVVRSLLKAGAKIDELGRSGRSALQAAAKAGHGHVVRLLCREGAKIDAVVDDRTALHRAAQAGHIEAIKPLLGWGADINAVVGDRTAVFLAAEAGHAEAVKLLITKGAEVHDPSGKIMSLHRAAKEQKENVVKLLLLGGASAKLDAVVDADAKLDAVTETTKTQVVRTLLSAGAIVDALGDDPDDPSGKLKRTALQAAAKAGYEKIVQILCEKGADVGAVAGDRTALHLAAQGGHFRVVKMLLDKNADIDGIAEDRTAVFLAAEAGYAKVVKLLVERGANVHDSSGKTMSLHRAAEGRQENVVKLLLKGGAEARLHVAAEAGELTVVQSLLNAGADVDTLGGNPQRTALQAAAKAGHEEVVRLLLEKKATINFGQQQINRMRNLRNVFSPKKEVENAYPTALYAAVKANHEHIVRLLLDSGADVNSQPPALEVATKEGYDNIIQLILAQPVDEDARRAARNIAKKGGRSSTIQLFSKTAAVGAVGSDVLQKPSDEGVDSGSQSRLDLQSMSKDRLKEEEVVGGSGGAAVDSRVQRNLGSPPQSRNGPEKQTVAEGDPNNPGSRPASKDERQPGEIDGGEILRLSALETGNKNIVSPKANDGSKEQRPEKGVDDEGASFKVEGGANTSRVSEAGSREVQSARDGAEKDNLSPAKTGARTNSQALEDRLEMPQSARGSDRNDDLLPPKPEAERNLLPKVTEEEPEEPQSVVWNDHEGTSPPSLDVEDINPSPQIAVPSTPSQVEIRSKGKQPASGENEKVDLLSSGAKNESSDLQLPEARPAGPKAIKDGRETANSLLSKISLGSSLQNTLENMVPSSSTLLEGGPIGKRIPAWMRRDGGRASSPVPTALSPTLLQDDPPAKPRSPTSQYSSVRGVNSPPPRADSGQSDSSLSRATSTRQKRRSKIFSAIKEVF